MRDVIEVVLLKRTQERGGGLLHPGETAAFSPDIAEDLVQRGVAQWKAGPVRSDAAGLPEGYVEEVLGMKDDAPIHPTPVKAVDGPEQNKMLDGKRTKKK